MTNYIIGIDDAARGPVIGPMILAGVIIKDTEKDKIKETEAIDSKLLTPSKRKLIGEKIKKDFTHHIEVTSPEEIDASPILNNLKPIKTEIIINKLSKDITGKIEVIVDCPSVNIKKWSEFVEKLVDKKETTTIKAEHKADFNHPIVSAASIIAKEKREEEIKKLRDKIKIDFGSGYPSDPKTVEFIKKYYDDEKYSKIIRHSWSTVKKLK